MGILNSFSHSIMGRVGDSFSQNASRSADRSVAEAIAKGAGRDLDKLAKANATGLVEATSRIAKAQGKQGAEAAKKTLTHAEIVMGARKPIVIRESMFHPVNAVDPASTEGKTMLGQLWDTKQTEKAFAEQSFSQPMQDSYRKLQQTLKGHPDGQLALQYLLQDKKLTIGGNNANQNLLGALKKIVDRKEVLEGPKNGINHKVLLSQQAQELADVISISQEHKGTCAATSAGQIMWAIKDPVDYTNFVVDMAANGKAKLPDGTVLKRVPDWRAGSDQIPDQLMKPGGLRDGRSIPSQLTQPAFMQAAVGKAEIYDNRRDLFVAVANRAKVVSEGGLMDEQTQNLVSSMYPGENWTVTYPSKADMPPLKDIPFFKGKRQVQTKAQMVEFLKSNASVDAPIPVGVNYQLDGGHELLVVGSSPSSKGGVDIHYINPWGRLEKMHEKSFELSLGSMVSGGSFGGVKV